MRVQAGQKIAFRAVLVGKDEKPSANTSKSSDAATKKLHAFLSLDPAMQGKLELMESPDSNKPLLLLVDDGKEQPATKYRNMKKSQSRYMSFIQSNYRESSNNTLKAIISEQGLQRLQEQRDYCINTLKIHARDFDKSQNFYLRSIAQDEAREIEDKQSTSLYDELSEKVKEVSLKKILRMVQKKLKGFCARAFYLELPILFPIQAVLIYFLSELYRVFWSPA